MSALLEKPEELTPAEVARAKLSVRAKVPELLSPAGDWDAMRAAVANGADAVYFGLDQFNARHRATNFKREELPGIMKFLHDRNVKGFLTLNTLLFSDELPAVQEYIRDVALAGVDAVIVQDLGLCRLMGAVAPGVEIHGSTQMTLTEHRGVEYVKKLGVTRAVLGRELSVDEIRKIALALVEREREVGEKLPELEVFIHGALCVSYSGQCLTSEALGGRSANRGQCAQACRLPYELVVDGKVEPLGDRAYLLSPQDLAGYGLVGELAEVGVSCLKIEGRLKAAHYVAATTQTYRAAIDAAARNLKFEISDSQKVSLEQTFSRGLTNGFLAGVDHQTLVHARFPKSRGRRLGVVEAVSASAVQIVLDRGVYADEVKAGDGVVFDEGHPEQDEQGGRIFFVRPVGHPPASPAAQSKNRHHRAPITGPARVEIELGRGDVNLRAIAPGAVVWKTDDPAMRKRLEQSFARDVTVRRVGVDAVVVARVGERLRLELTDGVHTASATWEEKPVEASMKFPATADVLREQVGRMGDSPFELRGLRAELDGGPMVPKSVLNELRRRCVEELVRLREGVRVVAEPDALLRLRGEALLLKPGGSFGGNNGPQDADPTKAQLHVLVRDLSQLDAVLAWGAGNPGALGSVYADFEDVRRYKEAVSRCRAAMGGAGVKIGLATVRVVKPREEGLLRFVIECGPDAVLVRNLAAVAVVKHFAPGMAMVGDYSLNVSNELTAALFAEEGGGGLARMVPSYDLSFKQLGAMLSRFHPGWFECVVHQHMPMFHTEHCTFAAMMSDGADYRTCGRPCESHRVELRDREGQPHPLLADVGCRNTVFNAAAQSALEYLPRMLAMGVRHFRVELLREGPESVGPLLTKYADVLAGRADAVKTVRSLQVLNQLGVVRGTLDRE